jgi:hypothetical protein
MQFAAGSQLASLDGWNLVFRCPKCGEKEKPAAELLAVVHRSTLLSRVLPRLTCPGCKGKPTSLEAVCVWAVKYGREPLREDLTPLLAPTVETNDAA